MYVQRNIVARSRNRCCHGKSTFISLGIAEPQMALSKI